MKKGRTKDGMGRTMNCLKKLCYQKALKGDIYCNDHRKKRDEINKKLKIGEQKNENKNTITNSN